MCASLSAVYLIENITIAKVSLVKFNETRYFATIAVVCLSNNQVPLSTGDLQVIPEVNVKCILAGELIPCAIAVPTYENNTCFNALLKVTLFWGILSHALVIIALYLSLSAILLRCHCICH